MSNSNNPPQSLVDLHNDSIQSNLSVKKFANVEKRLAHEQRKEESKIVCERQIAAFAQCSTGRTISVAWACRPQNQSMHQCMLNYMNHDPTTEEIEQYKLLPSVAAITAANNNNNNNTTAAKSQQPK